METIGESLAAILAGVRSFASVRAKMPSQLAYFNACIIAQCALEWFFVSVTIADVSRELPACDERHLAIFLIAFVWFDAGVRVDMIS